PHGEAAPAPPAPPAPPAAWEGVFVELVCAERVHRARPRLRDPGSRCIHHLSGAEFSCPDGGGELPAGGGRVRILYRGGMAPDCRPGRGRRRGVGRRAPDRTLAYAT